MLYQTESKREVGGKGGIKLKLRVCTEHTEAAGTLKVKINNSV